MPVKGGCPCGRGGDYATCCGRHHAGEVAPDAETLMRSRYSAYVLGDAAYLRATWHPETCPESLGLDTPDAPKTAWLGLTVKAHRVTGPDTAEVEFIARYRIGGGSAVRMQERSRFARIEGRWVYVDGEHH